ncbi:MAG TPA: RNA polymerase sigma factor [Kofleriaceae bacterium]|nr:RNA polymerase sigma factor [Kofleriaceae bacterium]
MRRSSRPGHVPSDAREAIDEQLREQLPRLRRFARWLCRDRATADDLVQAALERALTRWAERRDPDALRAWLFTILYRQFLDSRRRARRHAWLLDHVRRRHPAEVPSLERGLVANATLAAFAKLREDQRDLLYWASVEDLGYREIAAILDVPIGTVMSRLSRARLALRRLAEGRDREAAPSSRRPRDAGDADL